MTPTETSLIQVMRTGLRLAPAMEIGPETAIFGPKGLGLDSVDVLEIAVLLDKNFGVKLEEQSEEVHAALASIGTLAAYIDRRRAG